MHRLDRCVTRDTSPARARHNLSPWQTTLSVLPKRQGLKPWCVNLIFIRTKMECVLQLQKRRQKAAGGASSTPPPSATPPPHGRASPEHKDVSSLFGGADADAGAHFGEFGVQVSLSYIVFVSILTWRADYLARYLRRPRSDCCHRHLHQQHLPSAQNLNFVRW